MERYTFTFRVITPLFISGADQQRAELRPSSIRGALRFWFRAMMGGVVGGDWRRVKDLEADVFGDTEQASKFGIRIETSSLPKNVGENIGKLGDGIAYMGAGVLFRRDKNGYYKLRRGCYWPPESSPFGVYLLLRSSDLYTREVMLGTIWLLTTLGGLGSRIRRGFGSIIVEQVFPDDYDEKYRYRQGDIIEYLRDKLKVIAEAYRILAERYYEMHHLPFTSYSIFNPSSIPPRFSCFRLWRLVVIRDDSWGKWEDVMNSIGKHLQSFRKDPYGTGKFGSTYDYKIVSPFLDGELETGKIYDFRNDAFGLPIQYRSFSRSKGKEQVRALLSAEEETSKGVVSIDRRASPLIIRPTMIGDTWVVLLLFFNAEFLPDKSIEILSPIERRWPRNNTIPEPVKVKVADITLINNYLDSVKRKFKTLGELP